MAALTCFVSKEWIMALPLAFRLYHSLTHGVSKVESLSVPQ